MLGTKFYKGQFKDEDYANAAIWCNENNHTIEDKGDYYEVVEIPPVILSLAEKQESYSRYVEQWMNEKVREKDYESVDSCISRYINSTNEQYRKEAEAVQAWVTKVWEKFYALMTGITEGEYSEKEVEMILIQLPKLVW